MRISHRNNALLKYTREYLLSRPAIYIYTVCFLVVTANLNSQADARGLFNISVTR